MFVNGNLEGIIENTPEFAYMIYEYLKKNLNRIKEKLIENKDNLEIYKVGMRKQIKIVTPVEEMLKKYPLEKYPDYYKISLNQRKILSEVPDLEYEEKEIYFITKKKNGDN